MLSDSIIKELIGAGVLADAVEANVGPVSYDLRTRAYYTAEGERDRIELMPGDSTFVASVESIHLPRDLAARVTLRNSRIRQGLSIAAPVYFPGHETSVYFRVTNVGADAVSLGTSDGLAQLSFERVDGEVERPYEGAFSSEFNYRGLASYEGAYSAEMRKLERKAADVEGIEHRIYGNVLALFAVFAAIFTLVNVSAGAFGGLAAVETVALDLMVLGAFLVFAAVVAGMVGPASDRGRTRTPLAVGLGALAASVLLALLA